MLENYDHVILINNFEVINKLVKSGDTELSTMSHCKELIERTFISFLGKRLLTIEVNKQDKNLFIGLILQQDMINVRVEKGPVYGTIEAEKFKELWGDKSKLMHVDGNMHECVVWPDEGNLLLKIVDFIMKEKLGFPSHGKKGGWHQIFAAQIERCIQPATIVQNDSINYIDIKEAYDILRNNLCLATAPNSIKCLPVNIHDTRSIGSWFKKTNIFQQKCVSIEGFCNGDSIDQLNTVHYISLNVETNNKWPSDHDAFKLMKKLFMLKISKALYSEKRIYSKLMKDGSLDVHIMGFIFRCFLVINKEIANISKLFSDLEDRNVGKKNKNTKRSKKIDYETKSIRTIQKPIMEWNFRHHWIPEMNNQIRVFSFQFGQAYSDVCRISKRWLSSHLIDILNDNNERMAELYMKTDEIRPNRIYGHCFTEIAIELIVASLFIHPSKEYSGPPQSSLSGFIRFLKFFADFDWLNYPLVVNVKDSFTDDKIKELKQPFTNSENRHTEMPAMIIRIPDNIYGDRWTSQGPNLTLLQSVQTLAKQAYVSIGHLLKTDSDIKPLFIVDKSIFDVLFHLNGSMINLVLDKCIDRTEQEIKKLRKEKNRKIDDKSKFEKEKKFQIWPKDYEDNPIENLFCWIRDIVESDATCSYDKYGGRFFGLKWLKKDVDKDLIVKAICNKGRMIIAKCEILE